MGISKFNAGSRVNWNVESSEWEIKKLRELEEEHVYDLNGFFPTKENKFGKGAILISDGFCVGVPNRYHDLICDMLKDEEIVSLVKAGKCGFSYKKVPNNKGNDTLLIDFIDK